MTFAVVVGVSLRSGYALPPRHPDNGIVTETGGGSTYRRQNAVQTNPATSDARNKNHAKADWQFTTADARIKLKRLYPAL